MSIFDIEKLNWSEPQIIETRNGPRRIRKWKIPHGHPFWAEWKQGYLKQQGYQVRKWNEEWELTEWRELNGTELPDTQRATAVAQAATRMRGMAENTDPELPPNLAARFEEVVKIYDQIEADTDEDYRYQLPSIKRLALAIMESDGGFDGSDTGTGKTPVACGVAKTLGLDLFVVCPKSVIAPWHRMARLFGIKATIINYEQLRNGNTEFGSAVEEREVDRRTGRMKKRRLFNWNEDNVDKESTLICFDDCHKMKDWKTWNCIMGIRALQQGYSVLGSSATAADNPMQMKFLSFLTGLIDNPLHFYGWMSEHGVKKGKWGLEFVGGRDVLEKIHRQIFPARGSRIRIADLGDRFPQTRIIADAYNMNGAAEEIQAVYDEMRREIAKLEASEAKDRGANVLTEILRARQRVELLKIPTLVDMAQDGLEEGMSVVLVLNFEDSVQAACKRLKTNNTITGGDKPERRQELIDRFNEDDENLIVLNIKAGGVGVSLQGHSNGRPRLVLISPSYSGIDLKQALGRCWRAGGARSVQKIVFAADTIEERACAKVRARIRRIDVINDGELSDALQWESGS